MMYYLICHADYHRDCRFLIFFENLNLLDHVNGE